MILLYLGVLTTIIGGIGFLIAAFRVSILWGLGCFFISPIALIFLILYWGEAKNPFFLQLIGVAVIFLGLMSGGHF